MSSIYRQSKIGDALVEALDLLIRENKVTPDLAYKVLNEFDTAMIKALETKVTARAAFKGDLDTYRFCDNVWTFVLSNASFRTSSMGQTLTYQPEIATDKIKIVCVDHRCVEPDEAEV